MQTWPDNNEFMEFLRIFFVIQNRFSKLAGAGVGLPLVTWPPLLDPRRTAAEPTLAQHHRPGMEEGPPRDTEPSPRQLPLPPPEPPPLPLVITETVVPRCWDPRCRLCLDREGDHRQTKMKPISLPIDPEEAQLTIHLKFMHGMDLAHAKWTVEMGMQ